MFSRAQKAWLTVFFVALLSSSTGRLIHHPFGIPGPRGGLNVPDEGLFLHWFEELGVGLGSLTSPGVTSFLFLGFW